MVESYGTVSQIFPGGERDLSRKEDLPVAAKRLEPNIRRAILRNALRSALHVIVHSASRDDGTHFVSWNVSGLLRTAAMACASEMKNCFS